MPPKPGHTGSYTQHVHIHIHPSYTNKEMYISLHTPAQSFHPETMSSNKGSSSSKVLPSKEVLPSCDRIISMSNTEICLLTAYKMFPFKRVCAPLPKSIHTASYTHSTCMHNSIILTQIDVQLTASSSQVLPSKDVLQKKTYPPAPDQVLPCNDTLQSAVYE